MAQDAGVVTYAKLKSGEWGLRTEGELTPGESVTVTLKDDKGQKTETVGKHIITFDDGVSLYTIAKPERPDVSIPPADDDDVPF